MPGKPNPLAGTVGEFDAARALDMQEEGIDRIGQPEQFQSLPAKAAHIDLGTAQTGKGTAARRWPV